MIVLPIFAVLPVDTLTNGSSYSSSSIISIVVSKMLISLYMCVCVCVCVCVRVCVCVCVCVI